MIKALGYFEHYIDPTKRINIKAYDNEEHPSKGVATLPVQVGPVTTNITFQVLDRELGYNMLLGHPWTHTMQELPSNFHQYVKFSYNGIEITFHGDPNPFQQYNFLGARLDNQVPNKQEDPIHLQMESLSIEDNTPIISSLYIKEFSCGEYFISSTSSDKQSSFSPPYFGKPQNTQVKQDKGKGIVKYSDSCSFIRWGNLQEESLNEDINHWIYREEDDMIVPRIPLHQYGNGYKMLQRHGYDDTRGLGLQNKWILEPVLPQENLKNQGLGYKYVPPITKSRQRTLDIFNKPRLPSEFIPIK